MLDAVSLGQHGQQSVLGLGKDRLGVADRVQDAEGALRRLADAVVVGDQSPLFVQLVAESSVQLCQTRGQLAHLGRLLRRLSLRQHRRNRRHRDLDTVEVSRHARRRRQKSFSSTAIVQSPDTPAVTDTHTPNRLLYLDHQSGRQ